MKQAVTRRRRRSGGSLLGLIFLAVGIGMLLLWVGPLLHDWQRMQSWQPVTGELLSIELDSHRSDDSTTYEVRARYRYRWAGQEHIGTRVGIARGSDNLGSYQKNLYRRLQQSDTPTVWVNPDDPAESVLDRRMHWGMLVFGSVFVLAFGGVGLMVLLRGGGAHEPPPDATPDEARRLMREQGSNRIAAGGAARPVILWGLTLAAGAFSLPAVYRMREDLMQVRPEVLLPLIFAVVALGLLIAAIHATREYRRFGRLELVMDPYPGAIGGEFAATLDLRERFDGRSLFAVSLTCLRSYTTGSGKNRSRRTETLWQSEGHAQVMDAGRGTRLGMRFAVPPDLPASEPRSSDYRYWQLHVEAALPGVDLDRSFTVPMLPGSDITQALKDVPFSDRAGPPPEIPERALRIRNAGGATQFLYPAGRNLGTTLVAGLFGLACAAGSLYIFQDPDAVLGAHIMAGVLAFLAAATLGIALYLPLNSLSVEVAPGGITTRRRWLGLDLRTQHAGHETIDRIERRKSMESRSGGKSVIHYRLTAHTHDGRRIVVGEGLRGSRLAELVSTRLREALDLRDPRSPEPASRWVDDNR